MIWASHINFAPHDSVRQDTSRQNITIQTVCTGSNSHYKLTAVSTENNMTLTINFSGRCLGYKSTSKSTTGSNVLHNDSRQYFTDYWWIQTAEESAWVGHTYHLESRNDSPTAVGISSPANTNRVNKRKKCKKKLKKEEQKKEISLLTGLVNAKVSLYKEKLHNSDDRAYNSTLQHTLGTRFIPT